MNVVSSILVSRLSYHSCLNLSNLTVTSRTVLWFLHYIIIQMKEKAMIRFIRSNSPFMVVLCMLMVIQLVGCGEDADDDGEAPPLPPEGSMTVDLSLFDAPVPGAPGAATAVTYQNFFNAVIRVGTISTGLAAAASVPAAVFAAARLYEPTSEGADTWVWTYSVTVEFVTFAATLTGVKKGGDVTDWSMVVSADAPLYPVQAFLWYTGTSDKANLEGSWQFYDATTPAEQNSTVAIDWAASEDDATVKLTIENVDIRAENEYFGDVLDYDAARDGMAVLSYEDSSEGEIWDVVWNLDTGEGSLKVPEYNNGEEACWNSRKQDVQCE